MELSSLHKSFLKTLNVLFSLCCNIMNINKMSSHELPIKDLLWGFPLEQMGFVFIPILIQINGACILLVPNRS